MAVTIQPLEPPQIEAARAVITAGCLEFFGTLPVDFEDMADISKQYAAPAGTFLVLLDGKRVVGTGAIRRLDAETCELKRLWFLPEYRGRGLGREMAGCLFEFARAAGYKRIRLDSVPELAAANKLYQRLGFYLIERYHEGHGTIFMEKSL